MWRAYKGVIHCVFDKVPNPQNCFFTPNKNLGGEGSLPQIPLQVNFLFRQAACSLAGRFDNPIPTPFLAPIDCLKIPTLNAAAVFLKQPRSP